MADYFPGEIHIGGTLCLTPPKGKKRTWRKDIAEFISLLNDQSPDGSGGAPTYSINPNKPMTLRKALALSKEHAGVNGVLVCEDHEACGGMFEELETACRKLGLSYDRWSEAKYEYDGEYTRWRPGMKEPFTVHANNNGNAQCDRDPVLKAYNVLLNARLWVDGELNESDIKNARAILGSALYPSENVCFEPSPLPPFKVRA